MERQLARILEHLEDLKAVGDSLGPEGSPFVAELQKAGSHIDAARQLAKKAKQKQQTRPNQPAAMAGSHPIVEAHPPLRHLGDLP